MGSMLAINDELATLGARQESSLEKKGAPKGCLRQVQQSFFKYPNSDKWVLNGVSLRFQENSTVAFVGRSGAGKTSILDIISNVANSPEG